MIKHLQMHPHPGCCGAYNITHFGYSTTNAGSTGHHNLDDITQDLIECEKRIGKGILLATLNDEQVPHIEPILLKAGWSLIIKDAPGGMRQGAGMSGVGNPNPEENHTNNLYTKLLTKVKTSEVGALKDHGVKDKRNGKTEGTANTAARATAPKPTAYPAAQTPRPRAGSPYIYYTSNNLPW